MVNSTPNERQFARAMGIGIDGDQYPRRVCFSRILGGKVQPVGARIDLEEAAVLPRLLDDPIGVDFVTGTLKEQASRRMSEDIEVPVIHGAQQALGLLLPVKSEARMNRADRIVEFTQEIVGIVAP